MFDYISKVVSQGLLTELLSQISLNNPELYQWILYCLTNIGKQSPDYSKEIISLGIIPKIIIAPNVRFILLYSLCLINFNYYFNKIYYFTYFFVYFCLFLIRIYIQLYSSCWKY